jgi:hypothetical protein
MPKVTRNTVFVAGGQPSVTYVQRKHLDIERQLARAMASPNQVVSLAGPTKSGKTVLCRHVLGDGEYVWIEGGQVTTAKAVWDKICSELNFPLEVTEGSGSQSKLKAAFSGLVFSASGSQLMSREKKKTFRIDSTAHATKYLLDNDIALIIDDFHYLDEANRKELIRNLKGPVFKGLRVVLLSVAHRVFDAIRAETEMTGRFTSVTVPEWSRDDLRLIAERGFKALNIQCPAGIVDALANECQSSPFLMQRFCWEICYEIGVDGKPLRSVLVPEKMPLNEIYVRIAKDSGLPIYQRLVAGPPIRKDRMPRPLTRGGEADVYEVTLFAIAETGPLPKISYDVLRSSLNNVLKDKIPQRHEVTSVLKQFSKISHEMGSDVGIDWDAAGRSLDISDPFLRFYLRWQVRHRQQ